MFLMMVLSIILGSLVSTSLEQNGTSTTTSNLEQSDLMDGQGYRLIPCGSTAVNMTQIAVMNPQHPEAIYHRAICEAVIERIDPSINELSIRFKKLELYRPTYDGQCLQDRFAIYTDLNAIIGPVLCGNQTGRIISIPFVKQHTNLVVSVMTSDLDHDRTWHIEIEQRR